VCHDPGHNIGLLLAGLEFRANVLPALTRPQRGSVAESGTPNSLGVTAVKSRFKAHRRESGGIARGIANRFKPTMASVMLFTFGPGDSFVFFCDTKIVTHRANAAFTATVSSRLGTPYSLTLGPGENEYAAVYLNKKTGRVWRSISKFGRHVAV